MRIECTNFRHDRLRQNLHSKGFSEYKDSDRVLTFECYIQRTSIVADNDLHVAVTTYLS